ncbi:MAG: zinc ribbon-containing protein [Faecalispora sporosphaeroides]|uniref:zinc ribbon-containing protein n=1 Tax=Faecalispora sporosphaeroides TaxID=1549 RepID=UPI00399120AC
MRYAHGFAEFFRYYDTAEFVDRPNHSSGFHGLSSFHFDLTKINQIFDSLLNLPFYWYKIANKGGDTMYSTGEKPGKGNYQCTTCGEIVHLDDDTDTLPPCPKCNRTTYRKVG